MSRVGLGQDSHRFSTDPARALVLGGVTLPNQPGLDGHSDADVVLHALCRALEQAIGGDDFSRYADAMCEQGITDSRAYVSVALAHVEAAGYRVNNVGVTIEAKRPKIEPVRTEIQRAIAKLLGIGSADVGVNASSGEGMTAFGRGEGIQALVIVSLERR
ncbi:MAG TPA: 2-C-methyl-D-erythritol 2,4-cyclodiphosphate synthase [Casimicrobiaceae bacterium]|nr:2-C-methyl-D-erythritol 2,4-cyclodiphosphate synthase [Casimicrobiaceae bacterium]